MAYNGNSDYFANWNGFAGHHQGQPRSGTIRCGVPPVYGFSNESYRFSGSAPVAQMTPNHDQIQAFSMSGRHPMTNPMTGHHAIPDTTTASASNSRSDTQNSPISTSSSRYVKEGTTNAVGREAYEGGPPIMSNYPATYDPPPLEEPRHIPIPDDISLVRALNPYDKKQVDSDYMGFIIVLERLWSCFLREWLENFCRQQGPLLIRKEVVEAEVERVMRLWADKSVVVKQFPHRVEEVRDVAHVEYEWRVRCWHVGQHIEEYKTSTVLRLKKLGYLIGG